MRLFRYIFYFMILFMIVLTSMVGVFEKSNKFSVISIVLMIFLLTITVGKKIFKSLKK